MDNKAYAGRCVECGEVCAIMAIDDRYRKEIANEIGDWVRDGLQVELMTVEEAREAFASCTCDV